LLGKLRGGRSENIFKVLWAWVFMKKRVLLVAVLLLGILAVGLVSATNHTSNDTNIDSDEDGDFESSKEGIDKAYECLANEVEDKDLSLQEAIFAGLALGNVDEVDDTIDKERSNSDCWPDGDCTVKETAQVGLLYDRTGQGTEDIEDWLNGREQNADDLTWYLEIDISNHGAAECDIKYGSTDTGIDVNDDMTLTGSGGSCLDVAAGGFWLRVDDDCLDEEFEISCDEDFITTLLYRKGSTGTVFVSGETNSAASLGTTTENVNSKCFGQSGNCNYEGTLWTALLFNKLGVETDAYVPYLFALADDNGKYLPSSFLYILRNGEDQYGNLVQEQKQGQFWDVSGSPYNRFYDTALGLLGLDGTGASEAGQAKDYLISIQTNDGCWNNNNVRDTGFLLYAGWGRGVSGPGNGGGTSCTGAGFYCEGRSSCLDSGGNILDQYACSSFRDSCCSVNVIEASCSEKGGIVCEANQICNGRTESSSEGTCCIGDFCENEPERNDCVNLGGRCAGSCFSDEEASTDSCALTGDVCCKEKDDPSGSLLWLWILLIILIILVVLGIIFRNKLRVWIHKIRGGIRIKKLGGGKGGAGTAAAPRRPGPRGPPGMMHGFIPRGRPPMRRAAPRGKKDSEFEDTLKKLREMGK
tara:strand:+ start:20843 stop:22765 length:1923 start_codon:yes stop_codon:yes gene_type:complete